MEIYPRVDIKQRALREYIVPCNRDTSTKSRHEVTATNDVIEWDNFDVRTVVADRRSDGIESRQRLLHSEWPEPLNISEASGSAVEASRQRKYQLHPCYSKS